MTNERKRRINDMEVPMGYVAGLGRGASGFTTRSDIGPARQATDAPEERNNYARKRQKTEEEENRENEDINDAHFDNFTGYNSSICKNDPYEKDDEEADKEYTRIDGRMEERRKEKKEIKLKENFNKNNYQTFFHDVKDTMKQVTVEEWLNIPYVGDKRNKKARNPRYERTTPIPDSLLSKQLNMGEMVSSIDPRENGGKTPHTSGITTQSKRFETKKDAKNSYMAAKLSKVSGSVTASSVVNEAGYLTELQSVIPKDSCEIGDVKQTRSMLSILCKAAPTDYQNWINYVHLEERDGKLKSARKLIIEGCNNCPNHEDIWLEAARLHDGDDAKWMLFEGIKHNDCSVKLYIAATTLEAKVNKKKQILRMALDKVPHSVELWKAAIELEDIENAKLMLRRATECCPIHLEFWLALSKIETYDNAKKVLNNAINTLTNEKKIWIAAAELEESHGNAENVKTIIHKAVKHFIKNKQVVQIKREEWIEEAKIAEKAKYPHTCKAILCNVADMGLELRDLETALLSDIESFMDDYKHCARTMYSIILTKFPDNQNSWKKAVGFEKNYGTNDSLVALIIEAVSHNPEDCWLWLTAAKAKWRSGDVTGARAILSAAFEANNNSEHIWIAAAKLETDTDHHENAQILLKQARDNLKSERIYMKSVKLEWCMGHIDEAKILLTKSIELFPNFANFWMMKGQIDEQCKNIDAAKQSYQNGIRNCPNSIPLWLLKAKLEENSRNIIEARATLEKARASNPNNSLILLEIVRFENRNNMKSSANNWMSRALKEFPKDGKLWAEAIFMEPSKKRKSKSLDASQMCNNDIFVVLAMTKYFWSEGRIAKAREWFKKVIVIDQMPPEEGKTKKVYGDAYAFYYKFECIHGTEALKEEVKELCVKAEPDSGEYWCKVSKDVKNWKLKIEDILIFVAKLIPVPV